MTEKEALSKAISMWEFIKKEHLNEDGKYDLLKEYSNIYSKVSIEEAKAKYLCNYEYLDIRNNCYLCAFAFDKRTEENEKIHDRHRAAAEPAPGGQGPGDDRSAKLHCGPPGVGTDR